MRCPKLALLSSLVLLFAGCDPTYSVEYEISNRTMGQLNIEHSIEYENSLRYNTISSGTVLRVHSLFEIGTISREEIITTNMLPFDTLIISNEEGLLLKLDPLLIENWTVSYDNSTDQGTVELVVRAADFE